MYSWWYSAGGFDRPYECHIHLLHSCYYLFWIIKSGSSGLTFLVQARITIYQALLTYQVLHMD